MKTAFWIFAILAATSHLAIAQEDADGGSGGYGYTSVEFDPDTNTITVYAETDVDPSDWDYYEPGINTNFWDNQNTIAGSAANSHYCGVSRSDDGTPYSVSCSFDAIADDIYTARSKHYLVALVSDPQPDGSLLFEDVDYYSSFASSGQEYESPFGTMYTPPYQYYETATETIILGDTFDSRGTDPKPVCNDVRDNILYEYYTNPGAAFKPTCEDFTTPTAWADYGGFSYIVLCPTQTTGAGQYAVIQKYLADNLADVYNELGNTPIITSGYRNPAKEAAVGTYYNNSRHMAGDAVDLQTGGSQAVYNSQRTAALDNDACVEPVDPKNGPQKDYNHTHMDWRTSGSGNFSGPAEYPARWGN